MNETPQQPFPAKAPVKPGMVSAITILTLINGILNILGGLTLTGLVVVGTLGIGLLCTPLTILPIVLGIFEIIYAAKLMADPPKLTDFPIVIPILQICCILYGNVISLVIGILNLVFLNNQETKDYFAGLKASTPV